MEKQLKPKRIFTNPAFRDRVVILKTSEETGGEYSMGQLEVYPGGKNYMHTHSAFEETFTAVTGTLGVMLGHKKHYLKPGASITIARHSPHYFFNDGASPVTCQVKFVPGHEGFPKGLAIGYGLAGDGKTNREGIPKSLVHLALLITLTDTRPVGIKGMLFPFFKYLAHKARKNGTEKELLEKYYYEPV